MSKIRPCRVCKSEYEVFPYQYKDYRYVCRDCERAKNRARPRIRDRRVYRDPASTPVPTPLSTMYIPVPEAGCWLWLGRWDARGYGKAPGGRRGHSIGAHRLFYELTHGPIPGGLFVCHKCDTPACVNPDHLFAGTCRDNTHDMLAKRRAKPFGNPQTERCQRKYQALRANARRALSTLSEGC